MSKLTNFRRPATIALALTLSLGLAACGGGTPTPTVTAITIGTVSGDNVLNIGEMTTATVTVTGANNPSQSVTWRSSNTAVATVDANGRITAVAAGQTTITAISTVAGFSTVVGTRTITVVAATPTVSSVAVTATNTSLRVGQTTQATATVTGNNNPSQGVTFSSSNTAVATVSATGVITAVGIGTADIIATSTADTTKSGRVTITVLAALTSANINFQPDGFTTPANFTANTGAAYNTATGIGWVTEASAGMAMANLVPLNMTENTRNRSGRNDTVTGLSPEQYTQVNMQCGSATDGRNCGTGTLTPGAFEHRVVNGTYSVTVSVGESVTTDFNSNMVLNVEGINFVNNFVPTSAMPFQTFTRTVIVADGSLTVDAKGGANTKIQYLNFGPVQ